MRQLFACMGSRSGRIDRPFRLTLAAAVGMLNGDGPPAPRQLMPGRPSWVGYELFCGVDPIPQERSRPAVDRRRER